MIVQFVTKNLQTKTQRHEKVVIAHIPWVPMSTIFGMDISSNPWNKALKIVTMT